jgi:hypothetical protein
MRGCRVLVAIWVSTVPCAVVVAGDGNGKGEEKGPAFLIVTGGEVANKSIEVQSGILTAWNLDLWKSGVVFRLMGAHSLYSYPEGLAARIEGREWQGDAMIGTHYVDAKFHTAAYIGFDYQNHRLTPNDPTNPVRGNGYGFKVAAEYETDDSLPYYLSLEGAYSTAFETYHAQARVGLRRNKVVVGPEAGILGDKTGDAYRVGGFVTFEPTRRLELSMSSGYQFVEDKDSGGGATSTRSPGAYGRLGISFGF